MKSFEEILTQEPVYLHEWKCKIDLIGDFEDIYISGNEYNAIVSPYPNAKVWVEKKAQMQYALKKWEPIHILFASYEDENYSGDAFVLFEENGELFEVNGSHCSCYGLEGQWTPEEVTLTVLEQRLLKGTFGEDDYSGNNFKMELCEFLGVEYIENRR